MGIGDGVAQAFADLLGTTLTEGGYFAGAVFVGALFVMGLIFSSRMKGSPIAASGALLIGATISRLLQWWPEWTILIAALFLAVTVIGPLAKGD